MDATKQLIFVYSASSDYVSTIKDALYKLFNPSTYQCSLCALTYGLVSEKSKWKKFRKQSGIAMRFLHIDEYEKQYKSKFASKYTYPVILLQDHYSLSIFIDANKLSQFENVDQLIQEIEKRW